MLAIHAQALRGMMGSQSRWWTSRAQDLFQHNAAAIAGGALSAWAAVPAASVPRVLKAAPGGAPPALLGQLLTPDVCHDGTCAHLQLLTKGDLWPPTFLVRGVAPERHELGDHCLPDLLSIQHLQAAGRGCHVGA